MLDANFAHIAAGFSGLIGAPFVDGVATWQGVPTYDDGGSITASGSSTSYDCKVQIDAPTQAMRAIEGFKETDVRLLVLSASISRDLDTAATITADGATYSLLTCQGDAAQIGWECLARKVP